MLIIGLSLSCLGCSPRNGSNTIANLPKKEYSEFTHLNLNYCDYCTSEAEVRIYEDSLGSKELPLSILEIAQAFRYHPYESQDSSGIYKSEPMIGNYINHQFYAYFAFERKTPEISPIRVAILYVIGSPSSDNIDLVYEVEWKFFFKDPILERYEVSHPGLPGIDTGYVWSLFDTIADRVQDFFPSTQEVFSLDSLSDTAVDRFIKPQPETNDVISQNSQSGYFHIDKMNSWWALDPTEEIGFWEAHCPIDRKPYFFPDWRTHYQQIDWTSTKYLLNLPNPGKEIGRVTLALGWSSSPDYYHRDKMALNRNIHWFDIKPTDLAIYLVLTTAYLPK